MADAPPSPLPFAFITVLNFVSNLQFLFQLKSSRFQSGVRLTVCFLHFYVSSLDPQHMPLKQTDSLLSTSVLQSLKNIILFKTPNKWYQKHCIICSDEKCFGEDSSFQYYRVFQYIPVSYGRRIWHPISALYNIKNKYFERRFLRWCHQLVSSVNCNGFLCACIFVFPPFFYDSNLGSF